MEELLEAIRSALAECESTGLAIREACEKLGELERQNRVAHDRHYMALRDFELFMQGSKEGK